MRRRRFASRLVASGRPSILARITFLERRQEMTERYLERRLQLIDQVVDRGIALDQSHSARQQLGVSRVSLALSVLLFFAGMLTTFIFTRLH